jgi:hypothetical protein
MRSKSPTPIYCRCKYPPCYQYFEVRKRRKYCTRKCRDAAYYKRKRYNERGSQV